MKFITKKELVNEIKGLKYLGMIGNAYYYDIGIQVYNESDTNLKLVRRILNAKVKKNSNIGRIQVRSISKDEYEKIANKAGGEAYCSADVFNAFNKRFISDKEIREDEEWNKIYMTAKKAREKWLVS